MSELVQFKLSIIKLVKKKLYGSERETKEMQNKVNLIREFNKE